MNTRLPTLLIATLSLFIGGSVVQADSPIRPGIRIAIVGNTFADQLRSHGYLETLLLQHWKEEPVSVRNLGWAGDTLSIRDRPTNFPTEESTLKEHQTDVIIACFGMGESFDGDAGVANFETDLKAFIASHRGKQYNGESEVRLILVSPIAYEDLGELTPKVASRNRDLKRYTQAMKIVAAGEGVPFVDLYQPSKALMADSDAVPLTINGIHLSEYGYWAVARILYEGFVENAPGNKKWQLTIDAKAKKGEGDGLRVSKLSSIRRELSFQVTEESSPSLAPPTNRDLPTALAQRRDSMTVKNLQPGKYVLMVDGERVASATHEEWAEGVAIDDSPTHRDAESFRAAVNDKNQQFIYSWKALNQVHIVGERRNSPSGRTLPAEVIAFKKLADQKDEALNRGIELKTREWRLIPDTN
ncbi:MAG: SGNH/GDSL hydrolase family protein [Verrucomicrobiia bacterium]